MYIGADYKIAPAPGGFIAGSPPKGPSRDNVKDDARFEDARVKWARTMRATLRREKQGITEEMVRNANLFRGDTPWWKNRAKWKVAARLNYCFWVPTQWASVLADNKPKAVYSAYNHADQKEADIMTAAWHDAYSRNDWQQKIRDAILLSRIEKKAFLRLTFDPAADGGQGDPVLTVVSARQVYVNKGATDVQSADVFLYEYHESYGSIIGRYRHLEGILRERRAKYGEDNEQSAVSQDVPPSSFQAPNSNTTTHTPPYVASPNDPEEGQGTTGMLVQEWWTRPKGPRAECVIEQVKFTATNEPASKPKFMDFEDGHREPLQTVVTEGNIIYQLPMSIVAVLQYAGDLLGGLRILEVYDAVEVITEDVRMPLYPYGRRMVVVENEVADDGMNPFASGDWPFVSIDAYRDPKQFFGMGDIDIIYDLQEYANRLFSLFLDAAMLTSNPIWRLPLKSEISDEDITNAPGAVQREDMDSLRYGKRESGPELPQYLFQILQFTLQQIRDLTGLTEVATGGKFKGQQAAETVSMYQEAAGVRFRDALHNIEQAIERLGRQFMGIVGQFYTTPRLVAIKNEAGVEEPTVFFGTQLSAPMKMEAKSGSMLPTSPSARLNFMMNLMNSPKPIIDNHEIWSLLADAGLIDSATALERRIERELKNPAEQWKVIGLPNQGKPKQQARKSGSVRNQSGKN